MANSHQLPEAPSHASAESTFPAKILLGVGLVAALVTAAIITVVASSFAQMYESLGVDLPRATILIVTGHLVSWTLPAAVLLVWFRWPSPHRRPLWACLLGVLGFLLVVPFVIAVLLWPLISQ